MWLCVIILLEQVSPGEEKSQHHWEDEEHDEDEEDDEGEGELALWSPDVQVLELQKERDKGLGFSILDYQVTQFSPSGVSISALSCSLHFQPGQW